MASKLRHIRIQSTDHFDALDVRDRSGATEWKERFQRVAMGGDFLRAIRAAGGFSVVFAIPTPRVRDTDTDGACRRQVASRLSAQRLRNGADAHRMVETRYAARGAA